MDTKQRSLVTEVVKSEIESAELLREERSKRPRQWATKYPVLSNNVLSLIFHICLSLIFLPFNIFFILFLPVYAAAYIWFGYRVLKQTDKPPYLSVIAVTGFCAAVIAPSLLLGTNPFERIEAWANVWMLLAGGAVNIVMWLSGWTPVIAASADEITLVGSMFFLITIFIPGLLFMAGMRLRGRRLALSSKNERPD